MNPSIMGSFNVYPKLLDTVSHMKNDAKSFTKQNQKIASRLDGVKLCYY
jgi:hypothetical protein